MAEYTWKNLIYNPTLEEAKNAIGKECYFGATPIGCIKNANDDKNSSVLREVRSNEFLPFITSNYGSYSCIIVKEEQKPKYVPFENVTEFLDAYRNAPGCLNEEDYYLSKNGIWLKDTDRDVYCLVTEIWNYGVVVGDSKMNTTKDGNKYFTINEVTTWEELLMEYTFIDDSPCGKLAEEEQ